ncbi:MAG: hypothetical protein JRD05_01675 [Deltaproteobacteria bacterium]|nr:hypothetical protein [Deltaproteobacteria bacterium]
MPASSSNFGTLVKLQRYPRNIQYIPVVDPPEADRLPPLKVRDLRLELEQKLPFFKGFESLGIRIPKIKEKPENQKHRNMLILQWWAVLGLNQ